MFSFGPYSFDMCSHTLSCMKSHCQYSLVDERIESSSADNLGVLVTKILDMNWQYILTAQKASNNTLGCIKSSMTKRLRDRILFLYSALVRVGVLHPDVGSPTQEKLGPAGESPEATKIIRGLKHISYKDRQRQLGLFSLEKRSPWEDLKGLIRKTGADISVGPVAIGQGVMVLN